LERDAKNLAMSGKTIGSGVAVLCVVLLIAALIHGGEEPLRPIEQAIDLPETVR
jgi:hypothetical protein